MATMENSRDDILCIGFGSTALSLAISLREHHPNVQVTFLEKQPKEQWQPGVTLPGNTMRLSFLNDLVTLQNPTSEFTFINYLHSTDQLVAFTNLSLIRPPRELFERYLTWVGDKFESQVRFGSEVLSVEPVWSKYETVDHWKITYRSGPASKPKTRFAKKIISAVGQQPNIPGALQDRELQPNILHSSEYVRFLDEKIKTGSPKSRIAIVGGGEHAAEIFEHLHGNKDKHEVYLFVPDGSLKTSTDNSFVAETVKRPYAVQTTAFAPEVSKQRILGDLEMQPQSISPHLVERIYDLQYRQGVKIADSQKWRCQIHPFSEIASAKRSEDNKLLLTVRDTRTGRDRPTELSFDYVICATGYTRTESHHILAPLSKLCDQGKLSVGGDYGIQFHRRTVQPDVGVWAPGSFETLDDIDDNLYALLSARAHVLVHSIMAKTDGQRTFYEAAGGQARL